MRRRFGGCELLAADRNGRGLSGDRATRRVATISAVGTRSVDLGWAPLVVRFRLRGGRQGDTGALESPDPSRAAPAVRTEHPGGASIRTRPRPDARDVHDRSKESQPPASPVTGGGRQYYGGLDGRPS